jgi:hypothetical protein
MFGGASRGQRLLFLQTAFLTIATLASLLAFPKPSPAQELARRLILKDGSYQLVTKYETKGDRVRYYSAEREDWEELPTSLVDWPATEKYEQDRATSASAPEAVQLDKEAAHEAEIEQTKLPQVAPGLSLPEDSGVFLFDSFQGEPQLDEIQQNAADVNQSSKGSILRGAIKPIAGLKQTIEIDGAHASVQSHVAVPSLYINEQGDPDHPDASNSSPSKSGTKSASTPEGPEQPEQPEQAIVPYDRFIIVHAEVKGSRRVVGEVKRAVTGKVAQEQHTVKTTIDRVTGGWLKITPTEPLAPGEYALVETVGTEGMNLYVWDFGVNPKAPANTNPWKPEAASSAPKPAAPAANSAATPH